MARDELEVPGMRKNTKAEIAEWVEDAIEKYGLEWRVGYLIKLATVETPYQWRWVKDSKPVK
jgi:hypothetical protein